MTFQRWRKIKIRPNDVLYSKIIRHGRDRCIRCNFVRALQACHIMERGNETTRYCLDPRNAVPMCATCHSWFDTHKQDALLYDPTKRVFNHTQESYTFLVERCGYTWNQLEKLYVWSNQTLSMPKKIHEEHAGMVLRQTAKELGIL